MLFTARFARDAEKAKDDIVFIPAGPAAMKNPSATETAGVKAHTKQL